MIAFDLGNNCSINYTISFLSGDAADPVLPYYEFAPTDPSFEDMKKTVVVEKKRPSFPNKWNTSEVTLVKSVL